jgi:ribose-phosphate pyrophosphokinase
VKVVAGSTASLLGRELARVLKVDVVEVVFEKHPGGFPDGEQYVRLLGPVAGEHVALVQSTYPDRKIVELFLLQDALREAGAGRVTLVIPYFGYGRQDRKFEDGEPISARALARRIQLGADDISIVSAHEPGILRFFDIPARDVSGIPAIARHLKGSGIDLVLAPDANALRFAQELGPSIGAEWDFLEKKRIDSFTVEVSPKRVRVQGRRVAIVDDMISTGTSVAMATKMVREQGAKHVVAACVHGLFVGGALDRLTGCDEIVATDTVESSATRASVAPEVAAAVGPSAG